MRTDRVVTGGADRRASARRDRGTALLASGVLLATLLLPVSAAVGDTDDLPDPGALTPEVVAASIRTFAPQGSIRTFSPTGSILSLGQDQKEEDGETIIALATDLLFAPNSWDLPDAAPVRIAELVADVPEGATVRVTGHTDSRPTGQEFDNQELSESRAEAVAEALRTERPDLVLEVSGAGDSDPAAAEDAEDPDTFAANRRVEIAYES